MNFIKQISGENYSFENFPIVDKACIVGQPLVVSFQHLARCIDQTYELNNIWWTNEWDKLFYVLTLEVLVYFLK